MLDWVVFPCEKALGCSCRSERSRRAGISRRGASALLISGCVGVEPSPSPRSETKASLWLSQGQALILVLVLSSVLYAAIWATVALLSVAGGVNWGELSADS